MSPICNINIIYDLQTGCSSSFLIFEMRLQQEKILNQSYRKVEDPITFQVSCKNNLYRSVLSQTALDSDFGALKLCRVGKS